MRGIVQRVVKASVTVNDEIVSSIGKGICVLVGISRDDTDNDIDYMVRKLLNLRIWGDDDGKRWQYSLSHKKFEILCVSQFTLYCVLKGNSPDFHQAMSADHSRDFFNKFVDTLKSKYDPELVKVGSFGNYMQVHIQNDGPVTIQLESPVQNNHNQKQIKEKPNTNTSNQSQSSSSSSKTDDNENKHENS